MQRFHVFLPLKHHKLWTYSTVYYMLCKCCSRTLKIKCGNLRTRTTVYCIIVSPSSPIARLSPCTPLIRMILQTFLHLIRHSAISSFSLIFNLGFLSHPELPSCRFASPFSLSQQLSKEQKGQMLLLHNNQDSSCHTISPFHFLVSQNKCY